MEKFQYIPCCILSEILSRLPVESIIRFKSVCREWWSLINDPSFVELQLRRSKPRFMLTDDYGPSIRELHLLNEIIEERRGMWESRKMNSEYNSYRYDKGQQNIFDVDIVGSCNGLICKISASSHIGYGVSLTFCIYNPITRESVLLPVGDGRNLDPLVYGFGVDCTGKYKVIQLYEDDRMWKGEIFTLGETSWRKLEIPYESIRWSRYQKLQEMSFVDGALYFIVQDFINQKKIIIEFNIHKEKFHTTVIHPVGSYHEIMGHTVMKNSLVLYTNYPRFDIRLMMIEIKSKGNLQYQFQYINTEMPGLDKNGWLTLVGMLSSNMLLFQEDKKVSLTQNRSSHLHVYSVEEKKFVLSPGLSTTTPTSFKTRTFVPSLISPMIIC